MDYMVQGTCIDCGEVLTLLFDAYPETWLDVDKECACGRASVTASKGRIDFRNTREWNQRFCGTVKV